MSTFDKLQKGDGATKKQYDPNYGEAGAEIYGRESIGAEPIPIKVTNVGGLGVLDIIANVDVTQYPDGTPHAPGDLGMSALAVRLDTPAPLAGDGEWTPMQVNASGALRVEANIDADGVISTVIATTTLLPAAGVYTSGAEDMLPYQSIMIYLNSSTDSDGGGFRVEWSDDTVTWDLFDARTTNGTQPYSLPYNRKRRYVRVVFNNDLSNPQASFVISAVLQPISNGQNQLMVDSALGVINPTQIGTGQVVIASVERWFGQNSDPVLNTRALTFGTDAVDVTGSTVTVNNGVGVNVEGWFGSVAPTVGQKPMTDSVPVVIASDQTAVPVSATSLDIRPLTFATDTVDVSGSSVTVSATSLDIRPLTFATDAVDASGSTLGANSGVDIGDVTVNNGAGVDAVNIQDGGNSITVDATSLDIRPLTFATDAVDVSGSTGVGVNVEGWFGSVAPTVGQKLMADSIPVVLPSDYTLDVTDLLAEKYLKGEKTEPITLYFDGVIGPVVNATFREVASYTVPAGYSFHPVQFSTYTVTGGLGYVSRAAIRDTFGSVNVGTGVFTDGTSDTFPDFSTEMELFTTVAGNNPAGASITVTITYVNEYNVGGRVATATWRKNSILGERVNVVLQSPDIGFRDVTNITRAGNAAVTGAFTLIGSHGVAWHFDDTNNIGRQTMFGANNAGQTGGLQVPENQVIKLEIKDPSTSAVQRILRLTGFLRLNV